MVISSLDTHESVKSLTAVGFPDAQAKALTAVVKPAVDFDLSSLATKADLAETRRVLSGEIADLRREVSGEIADLRREVSGEIADLRREMAQLELRLRKWMIGIGIAAVVTIGGMLWAATQVVMHGLPHP